MLKIDKMAAHKGNKYALGNKGGRPPKYKTPSEMQAKIDEYFETGRNTRAITVGFGTIDVPVITICGLAYYLGFASRQSLIDYEKDDMFSDTIKRAKLRVEMIYEENLQYGQPTGSIFALKNFGWKDKTEQDHNITETRPVILSSEKGRVIIEKIVNGG